MTAQQQQQRAPVDPSEPFVIPRHLLIEAVTLLRSVEGGFRGYTAGQAADVIQALRSLRSAALPDGVTPPADDTPPMDDAKRRRFDEIARNGADKSGGS